MISERTRAALASYEARGGILGATRLGGRRPSPEASARGREAAKRVIRARADAAYAHLMPMVVELRGEGLSLRQIAEILSQEGYTTRRGKPWNPVQVARVIERAGG